MEDRYWTARHAEDDARDFFDAQIVDCPDDTVIGRAVKWSLVALAIALVGLGAAWYVAHRKPPPPPATQTCPDGSVILATAVCPPPPPPPPGERG